MSDPFDVLRTTPPRGAPDVGAIKGRARRIERRRRIAISSAAVVIAAVAVGGVVLRPGGGPSRTTVAQRQLNTVTTTTPQPEQFKAAAPLAPAPTTAETNGSSAGAQATAQRSTPAPPRSAAGPSSGAAGTPTGLQLTVTAQGTGPHMERFTLQACNPSSSSVSVTFPTGQRYDFEVRQNNTLVWRWSDGMAFTMIYGQESWAPKQCKTYTATWNGTNSSRAPAASGSYTVTGVLTSSPRQSTAPKAFCLDVC